MIFISHDQSSVVSQPCESALYYISSPVAIPESVVLSIDVSMILPVRRKEVDTSLPEHFPVRVTVVGLVSDHSFGSGPWSSRAFLPDFDVRHDLLEQPDLSRRGRRGMASQRNTLAVDHHQVLRSFALLGFSDRRAPFFAGTKVASTKDSSQSRMPSSSNSERKVRHMSLNTPASCHSLRRRQHVEGWGYIGGRSFHLAPVLRTHRIPSKTSRSATLGRPPLGFSGLLGIKGAILVHCSSVNIGSRTLIGSPPKSVIREIYRKYNPLFNTRYPMVTRNSRFCNHF